MERSRGEREKGERERRKGERGKCRKHESVPASHCFCETHIMSRMIPNEKMMTAKT